MVKDAGATPVAWRLLELLAPYRGREALAVLLAAATVGAGVGLLATAAYIIAAAALRPSVADLAVAIVGVRFFGLARGVLRYLERHVAHDVTFRLLSRLRVWFYGALEPLAPAALTAERSGDLLARFVGDVDGLQFFFLRGLAPATAAALVVAGAALGVGALAPAAGLALLALLLAAGLALPLWVQHLGASPGQALAAARAHLAAEVVDTAQGLPDLLAYGREQSQLGQLAAGDARLAEARAGLASVNALQGALSTLLAGLGGWAVLVLAVPLVRAGSLDGLLLAVLVLAALASFEAVAPLPQAAQQLGQSLAAAGRLFAVADRPPAVTPPAAPVPPPRGAELVVEGLRLRYQPDEPPGLVDVSLALRPGRLVAVVGPSGAGKSSLLQALCRFWEYEAGQVWLDGHDLRAYRPEDVRRCLAVVSQRPHLFNGSIADNLRLAKPQATAGELRAVVRTAGLEGLVSTLPEGYDTWVGEAGLRLSGGERQRLALARALLKGAPFLFLDEPTANLDTLSESAILQTIRGLRAERAVLLATHRLLGLAMADEIIVLLDGRVAERGREEELLARGVLYRRLWQAQREALADGIET